MSPIPHHERNNRVINLEATMLSGRVSNNDGDDQQLPTQETVFEDIVCPRCTLKLNPFLLDEHLNECEYTACRFCRDYYPNSIISMHRR